MGFDLTVAAIPFYFGSMGAEHRALARRAETDGPSPGDYQKDDTVASLAMGVASLLAPFAAQALVRKVVPRSGRFPKLLVRTAVASAVATTAADAFNRWDDSKPATVPKSERRRRLRRLSRRVAHVGGPVAVATGGLALSSTASTLTKPERMWEKNKGRDLGTGPLAWAAAIAGWDFIYYWNHRFMHEVRALWAIHVVHHSSERYNLSTALRQPVADVFGVFLPYGLLSRLGVRPALVEQARAVNLLYQYWIHTDAIRSIGKGEQLLNTPSHHRVHHGSNRQYIDRNHGSMLIVWDKLFGTFEPEGEPVVYGLTKNIDTYNPARIASHEHRDIVRDVADSSTWRDRLSFVLRGPGWAYERHAATASAGIS